MKIKRQLIYRIAIICSGKYLQYTAVYDIKLEEGQEICKAIRNWLKTEFIRNHFESFDNNINYAEKFAGIDVMNPMYNYDHFTDYDINYEYYTEQLNTIFDREWKDAKYMYKYLGDAKPNDPICGAFLYSSAGLGWNFQKNSGIEFLKVDDK